MRILLAFRRLAILALVVAAPLIARADATAGPGQCVEVDNGCGGCGQEICNPALPPDMSMPTTHDGGPGRIPDGGLDACRERARRRNRAHGRGLVLLSGLTAVAVFALRRRYKTMRPTPADSALAASDTRSDS